MCWYPTEQSVLTLPILQVTHSIYDGGRTNNESCSTHTNQCVPSRGVSRGLGIFRSSQIASDAIWDNV